MVETRRAQALRVSQKLESDEDIGFAPAVTGKRKAPENRTRPEPAAKKRKTRGIRRGRGGQNAIDSDEEENDSIVKHASASYPLNEDATFFGIAEELRLSIYENTVTKKVYKPYIGDQPHVCWQAHKFDSGIVDVNRQTKGSVQGVLNALDRKDKARTWVHWSSIKQLRRLLQLIVRAYSWGERWLKANPPNAAGDSQDWQWVKAKISHNINQLVHEYLDPASYKRMYKKLRKSNEIGHYPKRWFKAIAKACDTAAPIAMNDVE
jgi:hypothetical protein